MNKKAQTLLIIAIMIIGALILYISMSKNKVSNPIAIDTSLQEGSSTDYVYTIEKGKISGWNKLYLKDDHKTMYCFDNPIYIDLLKTAQEKNIKVIVYYKEYFIKGALCMAPTNVDTVVVYDIQLKE